MAHTPDLSDFIDTATRSMIKDYVTQVDQAILEALDGAEHGVLVTWSEPKLVKAGTDGLRLEGGLDVRVDPSVPFGSVWERRV